jgi:hypothetical protein
MYDTLDPVGGFIGTLGQTYPPDMFAAGLTQIRTDYVSTGQLSTYYEGNAPNDTIHQILFDPRLYTDAAGSGTGTVADFLTMFTADTMNQVGP